jgi:hypothetical protein
MKVKSWINRITHRSLLRCQDWSRPINGAKEFDLWGELRDKEEVEEFLEKELGDARVIELDMYYFRFPSAAEYDNGTPIQMYLTQGEALGILLPGEI